MTAKRYDVALSYAGEDREYVEAVADALVAHGLRVFYDRFEEADMIGRNLVDHLSDVYQHHARLCLIFVSAAYARKPFTRLERQAAQATALTSDQPYVIPVRLDDTPLPGLLPQVAYISRRDAADVARLVAAKLLLDDQRRAKPGEPDERTVIVRFTSLLSADMATFQSTFANFKHWSPEKFGSIPVTVTFSREISDAIDTVTAARGTAAWHDRRISDDAREQVAAFYDRHVPSFLEETARATQRILRAYGGDEDRLISLAKRYLSARALVLARLIQQYRLVTMPPFSWEGQIGTFGTQWGDNIMLGLPYICYLENTERYLWVDADAYYSAPNLVWTPHYRVYVPAEFVIAERDDSVSADDFDHFFAPQFAELEARGCDGFPLFEFARSSGELRFTIRGEWAYDTEGFQQRTIINGRGKDVAHIIPALLALTGSEPIETSKRRWIHATRVRRLFCHPEDFDELFEEGPGKHNGSA